jgi:hypothetical protein
MRDFAGATSVPDLADWMAMTIVLLDIESIHGLYRRSVPANPCRTAVGLWITLISIIALNHSEVMKQTSNESHEQED